LTTSFGDAILHLPLLNLTTIVSRLVLPLIAFLAWTPSAFAWSWPVQGPVLQPFVYDVSHPYASGQHRGIDIGASVAGETVVAPAAGTVSFSGTVPTSGKSVTIETPDGYSVTLTHLGSSIVAKGAAVTEGETLGTIGPSGTAEEDGPYVHLGIRVAADPNGYVDPLSLLPTATSTSAAPDDSTSSPPSASGGASGTPATGPPPAVAAGTPVASTGGSIATPGRSHVSRYERGRAQKPGGRVQRRRSSRPSAARAGNAGVRAPHHAATPQRRLRQPTSFSRRPVLETAARGEPAGLDVGHEARPSVQDLQLLPVRRQAFSVLLPLVCNGAAALVAVAAALAEARRRLRRSRTGPIESAQVLHLPRPSLEREQRAA
jgi:Peptidase family M23